MNVHYHPDKANVVTDGISRMTIGSVFHLDKTKKDLAREVHRLDRLGMRLESSPNGGAIVHYNSESSLVAEVKSKQHINLALVELKESVLGKLNESFYLETGVLRYQNRLCVPDVEVLRDQILEEAHGFRYSIHQD